MVINIKHFALIHFKLLILIICSIFLARGYPTLHLAIIFDDGLVCDFSVKNKTFQDFNTLMKLSKSEQYFGYSDENGVLYFIHSDTGKGITKFHKSFNKKGHIAANKSKRSKALMKEIESPHLLGGIGPSEKREKPCVSRLK